MTGVGPSGRAAAFLLTLLVWGLAPGTAAADLVKLKSGRTVAIRALVSDSETGRSILHLRDGGEVECDTSLIAEVLPEEVASSREAADAPEPARPPDRLEEPSLEHLPHATLVARIALAHGLRPSLIHAIVAVESGHSVAARSPKGAAGLMQLMPATAAAYGVGNLFDPERNLEAGVRHIRDLLTRHSLPLALAAYNAGESTVQKYRGIPPFAETRTYVERVLKAFQRLSGFRPGGAAAGESSAAPGQAMRQGVQPMRAIPASSGDSAIISQ